MHQKRMVAPMSPLAMKLIAVFVVVILFCFAEAATGSCLNYGHACWGAHGKRSDPNRSNPKAEAPPDAIRTAKLLLAKLIRLPSSSRYAERADIENYYNVQPDNGQDFSEKDVDPDTMKRLENLEILREMVGQDETTFADDSNARLVFHPRTMQTGANFLEKRSTN